MFILFLLIKGVANHDVFFGTASDESSYLIDINLQLYENLTAVAGSQGTQVLVFPEFGLESVRDATRADLYSYAETVPAVSDPVVTPCDDAVMYVERPILYRMSCAAKKNSLLVLVNMVDLQPCEISTDENCPEDGHYQVTIQL
jgi:pantetheine hydrolase